MSGIRAELISIEESKEHRDELRLLEIGCKKVGLVAYDEHFVNLIECTPWVRGGAETYISTAILFYQSKMDRLDQRKIIAKAYAGMGLGSPPETRVCIWQERAAILEKAGVSVSKVYGTYAGVLYSEHIESSLVDYLNLACEPSMIIWAGQMLFKLVKALDSLQVSAVSLLPDLRTDGEKIYLVDFGEDIGGVPGTSQSGFHCRKQLLRELYEYGFETIARNLEQYVRS